MGTAYHISEKKKDKVCPLWRPLVQVSNSKYKNLKVSEFVLIHCLKDSQKKVIFMR